MRAATLFSGIGAPETAMPHWDWLWHAEVEKFPAAIMAARHPGSVNLGDVNAGDFSARAKTAGSPDIIIFGSPCQSFSIAGRRLGLDDPRGNLALRALRIIGELRPTWFCFENVLGLLSNANGRDYGVFLSAVGKLGYSFAWSMLDAQYFGVAQRRRRLFAVGYSGDWRHPAAVLLEPASLCGDSPPRREARQEIVGAIGGGSKRSGGRVGRREAAAGQIIAIRRGGSFDVAPTLNSGGHSRNPLDEPLIAHTLRGDGFDAGEDGTGRGIPLVATVAQSLTAHWERSKGASAGNNVGVVNAIIEQTGVRRLTPRECERLQGFPDDFTAITYRRKPAADGPRYKALGNSMAVPVVRWILNRIEQLETAA